MAADLPPPLLGMGLVTPVLRTSQTRQLLVDQFPVLLRHRHARDSLMTSGASSVTFLLTLTFMMRRGLLTSSYVMRVVSAVLVFPVPMVGVLLLLVVVVTPCRCCCCCCCRFLVMRRRVGGLPQAGLFVVSRPSGSR